MFSFNKMIAIPAMLLTVFYHPNYDLSRRGRGHEDFCDNLFNEKRQNEAG